MSDFGFKKTGLIIPTFDQISDKMKSDARAGTNTKSSSIVGMIIEIISYGLIQIYELIQQSVDSFDVDKASGIWLDKLVRPIIRNKETRSQCEVIFTGEIGLEIPKFTEVNSFRTRRPAIIKSTNIPIQFVSFLSVSNTITIDQKWKTLGISEGTKLTTSSTLNPGPFEVESVNEYTISMKESLVTETGYPTVNYGAVKVVCESIQFGKVSGLSGDLNDIKTPVNGLHTALNIVDAKIGKTFETDDELRLRFFSSANSLLVSKLLDIDRVKFAREHASREVIDTVNGIPPRSLSIVIWPAGEPDYYESIAKVIASNTDPYAPLNGNVSIDLLDRQGRTQNIKFYTATEKRIYTKIEIKKTNFFPAKGDKIIRKIIQDYGSSVSVGDKILSDDILVKIMSILPGINSIDVKVGLSPGPTNDFLELGLTSIGTFQSADIEVVLF